MFTLCVLTDPLVRIDIAAFIAKGVNICTTVRMRHPVKGEPLFELQLSVTEHMSTVHLLCEREGT